MFETFELRKMEKGNIIGYKWTTPHPEKIVCLIHGIGEYAKRYDRMASFFLEKNISTFSMDLRGHGLSLGKRGHCAPRKSVLEDIDRLIDYVHNMYPNVPIVLYGHSMGGNIALDYRVRGCNNNLISAFIISAPWILLYNKPSKITVAFANILSKVFPEMTIKSEVDEKSLGNPDMVRPYSEDALVHDKISAQCASESFRIGKSLETNTIENNNCAMDKPMLLMHGTNDTICDIEGSKSVNRYNNCTFVQWEGYLHEIHNGNSITDGSDVIKKSIEFIKSL